LFLNKLFKLNLKFTKDEWLLEQRMITITIMSSVVVFVLLIFSGIRFVGGDIVASIADAIGATIFIGLNIALRKNKQYYNIISIIFISVVSLVVSVVLLTMEHDIFRGVWFIAILVLAYYLRDAKEGRLWSIAYIIVIIMSFLTDPTPNTVGYAIVIVNLILVSTILNFYEKIKDHENKAIEEQKNILEKEVLKRTLELNNLNDNLEQRIKEEVYKHTAKDKMMVQQNKMAMMGEMITNIAHQFRQPLSAISSTSSGILFEIECGIYKEESTKTNLNKITGFVNHLSSTIDDFRNFFQEDKEKVEFNLSENISQDLFIIESTTLTNNIKIIKDFDNSIKVTTFKNELTQSILNILNNAQDALVEFIPKDQERFIFMDIKQNQDKINIVICDNAGGIPQELISKVFDDKFTTKKDNDGTGIGLFMTKKMIENNIGGIINVINKEYIFNDKKYKGAQFTITI